MFVVVKNHFAQIFSSEGMSIPFGEAYRSGDVLWLYDGKLRFEDLRNGESGITQVEAYAFYDVVGRELVSRDYYTPLLNKGGNVFNLDFCFQTPCSLDVRYQPERLYVVNPLRMSTEEFAQAIRSA